MVFRSKSNNNIPKHAAIERARFIAYMMDSAFTIPFIRKKIGLDPLVSLIPVAGDLISMLVGCYLIWVAVELQLPQPVIMRMLLNSMLDFLIGSIPVFGDVTDVWFKSNQWNFKLLESAYQASCKAKQDKTEQYDIIDVHIEQKI